MLVWQQREVIGKYLPILEGFGISGIFLSCITIKSESSTDFMDSTEIFQFDL